MIIKAFRIILATYCVLLSIYISGFVVIPSETTSMYYLGSSPWFSIIPIFIIIILSIFGWFLLFGRSRSTAVSVIALVIITALTAVAHFWLKQ